MKLSDFDYSLPRELIAQYPVDRRDRCRLMVLDRRSRTIQHRIFEDVVDYFNKDDCLILNDTKVIPARLFGRRKTGGKVELFLLEKKSPICEALVRPAARLREGERVILESGDEVEILGRGGLGRFVKFGRSLDDILKEAGHIPLPPYIDRDDETLDRDGYQTIFGVKEGATASPTAGLHFTKDLLEKISERGVNIACVTLHTNYGTFAPVKTADVESHRMHKEYYEFPEKTAGLARETKRRDGKIFAVGTTTSRVLEYRADKFTKGSSTASAGQQADDGGYTDFFIYPGYNFKVVDHLITNFHLPKSTLLLLVAAFAGKDFIFEAYHSAIEKKYRFFSYGDAMLIL